MSDQTRDDFDVALTAHTQARQEAALSGQHPDNVDAGEVVAAARAHLAEHDPGFEDRTAGMEPHQKIAAPDLKAAYDKALAAAQANPADVKAGEKAQRLGTEYAQVRAAARIVDTEHGRSWGVAVHTPEGDES